jgi:hypothetical protein
MNPTRAALLASAVLLSAAASQAQPSPPPAVPAEPPSAAPASAPAVTTPAAAAPQPAASRRRAVSPGLASALAAAMPKYSPPVEPPPKTAEEEAADKPRNQIIRLPTVVVEGDRPPVFTERQLYTRTELARLAARRYLSELDRGVLNRFTLPVVGQSAEQRGMTQYEEEERQRNIASANQAVYLLKQSDPAAASALQRDAADAYIRPSEFTRISTER